MDRAEQIHERAQEYVDAAVEAYKAEATNAAFEMARTAAELASKALLQRAIGTFPKVHDPSGELVRQGLLPTAVRPSRLRRFLDQYARGIYDFRTPPEPHEVREGIAMAQALLAAFSAPNP